MDERVCGCRFGMNVYRRGCMAGVVELKAKVPDLNGKLQTVHGIVDAAQLGAFTHEFSLGLRQHAHAHFFTDQHKIALPVDLN